MDIDLTRDAPEYVKDQARKAVRRMIAKEIDINLPALKSNGRGPITRGIRKTLRRNKKLRDTHPQWENKHVCALRSAITNGQWTNERLHKANL